MATGGYNASFDENPTGFGSDSIEEGERSSNGGGGYTGDSAPLFGIDYKRYIDDTPTLNVSRLHVYNYSPHTYCIVTCIYMYRNEELKIMLDGTKDGLKLDAMKMIIGVRASSLSL